MTAVARSTRRAYNVITEVFLDMRTELVRIGNSRGIRIPKPLIEQCGFRSDDGCCQINQTCLQCNYRGVSGHENRAGSDRQFPWHPHTEAIDRAMRVQIG